jgi:hypothetical protein
MVVVDLVCEDFWEVGKMRAGFMCAVGKLFAGDFTDVACASKGEEEA